MDFRDAMRSGWIWVLLDPELVVRPYTIMNVSNIGSESISNTRT